MHSDFPAASKCREFLQHLRLTYKILLWINQSQCIAILISFKNFPNPFNPVTKISWKSPTQIRQPLKLFDMPGKEVYNLVEAIRPAGYNETTFDASGLTSGVYYYQLRINEVIQTKKLLVLI